MKVHSCVGSERKQLAPSCETVVFYIRVAQGRTRHRMTGCEERRKTHIHKKLSPGGLGAETLPRHIWLLFL